MGMVATDITNFTKGVSDYVTQAVRFNEVISVATDEGGAILMGLEDYNALMETAYILSHPGTARDIQEGLDTAWEDCVPEAEALAIRLTQPCGASRYSACGRITNNGMMNTSPR